MLRVFRQPNAFSAFRKTLSCAAVANKQIEIKDHYDFDQRVRETRNLCGMSLKSPLLAGREQ